MSQYTVTQLACFHYLDTMIQSYNINCQGQLSKTTAYTLLLSIRK